MVNRLVCYLLVFILTASLVDLDAEVSDSKCRGWFKKFAAATLTVTGLMSATSLYHDLRAMSRSEEHIGMGIYLSMQDVFKILPPDLRMVAFKKDKSVAEQTDLAHYFNSLLEGDYDFGDQFPDFFPDRRSALSYMKGFSLRRGVCRQKSVVLAEILNRLGIQSVVMSEMPLNQQWHAWVYVPHLKLRLDPSSGSTESFIVSHDLAASELPYDVNRVIGGIVR